jgi:hypothetical protein
VPRDFLTPTFFIKILHLETYFIVKNHFAEKFIFTQLFTFLSCHCWLHCSSISCVLGYKRGGFHPLYAIMEQMYSAVGYTGRKKKKKRGFTPF